MNYPAAEQRGIKFPPGKFVVGEEIFNTAQVSIPGIFESVSLSGTPQAAGY